jgi:chromosome segregation ATPase
MTQAKHASQTVPEELIDEFNGIITEWKENGLGKTVHQLEISIEEEIAKSQAIRFANPNAMANFEKRKKEIEQLENKIAEDKADLLTLGMQITEIRVKYLYIYKL